MAYCRTTTCDRSDAPPECATGMQGICMEQGTPVAWPNTCVSMSVSAQGSLLRHITADQLRDTVEGAFRTWMSADCGNGQHPNFVVNTFPDVNCTDVTGSADYKQTGPNYNVWIFMDAGWPNGTIGEGAIATTVTQFNPNTGEMLDADVELNSEINRFTTGDIDVSIDLHSVALHEAGHFLGLAHSDVNGAVMQPSAIGEYVIRRALADDDVQGICSIYPPGQLNPYCDPTPRHGFSTECEFSKGGCSVVPGRHNRHQSSVPSLIVGLLSVAVAARVRRARRKSCTSPRAKPDLVLD